MRTLWVVLLVGAQPPDPSPVPLPVPTRELVTALIETLRDPDAEVRQNAAFALAAVGTEAVEPLTATLRDRNPDARAAAAYALGEIGASAAPATAELLKTLKDEDKEPRRQAALAVGRIVIATRAGGTAPTVPLSPIPAPVFPPLERIRP